MRKTGAGTYHMAENFFGSVLRSSNLLSLPCFKTLWKRNVPSRPAQRRYSAETMSCRGWCEAKSNGLKGIRGPETSDRSAG